MIRPRSEGPGGYISSDGGGTVRRCGCFICGIDFRWRKFKTRRHVPVETKSDVVLPPESTMPSTVPVRQLPCFSRRFGTDAAVKGRNSIKTGLNQHRRHVTNDGGLLFTVPSLRHHDDSRHRAVSNRVGQREPETVSLSHYYRRHHRRAHNHSRAMRQVAEWIENSTGVADKLGVVSRRQQHTRHHIHEHRHHHYHYHYSISGIV